MMNNKHIIFTKFNSVIPSAINVIPSAINYLTAVADDGSRETRAILWREIWGKVTVRLMSVKIKAYEIDNE